MIKPSSRKRHSKSSYYLAVSPSSTQLNSTRSCNIALTTCQIPLLKLASFFEINCQHIELSSIWKIFVKSHYSNSRKFFEINGPHIKYMKMDFFSDDDDQPLVFQISKEKEKKGATLSVSPMHHSRGTFSCKLKPKSTMSEKSKVKQMSSKWENKRRLAKQRLMDLTYNDNDTNGESVIAKTPILRSSVGVSNSTMERAEVVKANLPPRFPCFLKLMLKSHVTGGFWLGLPKKFCVAHLPDQDETVVLVDENEEEYNTKYLVDKNGLSGGWRGFSIAHNLLDEDVLVFQLIEPCKFKVYIVSARILTEIDGVTNLLNLNIHADPINNGDEDVLLITERTSDKYLELVSAEDDQKEDTRELVYLSDAAADQPDIDSDHSSSETMDVVRFSESVLSFKDVKGFEDFNIHVDGLMIDAEIPIHLRTKYYELCRSQNTFLHENLMHGLNTKLAAGMISETINIADAIKAAKPNTGTNHLLNWDTTLKAFEDLGMVVGFLRARIDKLLSLSNKVQAMIELKSTERDEAKEEMQILVMKLSDVKMRIQNLDDEIDVLVVKKEELSSVFIEVAGASW